MPNLVYLYTSGGAPKTDLNYLPAYDPTQPTNNRFALMAPSDGMVNMFRVMTEQNHFDRLSVIIDSTISPGSASLGERSTIFTVPSMSLALGFIRPGDILIVRGGFRSWYPLLDYIYKRRENWILFYRANTNRHPWPFWDITLNDLISEPKAFRGRLHYNFSKPVNEDVFGIIDAPNVLPREYDVMVGASHIHRKKGQHITLQALQKYYELFNTKPKAILPGGYMRCLETRNIQSMLKSGTVDVHGPHNMTRAYLALQMNRTKLFVHPGYGGQNDRGILEAMCCGCLPLIFGQRHVSPVIWDHAIHIPQDPSNIASIINQSLDYYPEYDKTTYQRINGLHEVCIPKMLDIVEFISNHPSPDRSAACARFIGGESRVRLGQSI